MTPPTVQFIPAGGGLGDLVVLNALNVTWVGGVENSISPDINSTVYNGWDFQQMDFRDAVVNGVWTNDGAGLLWYMKDATNYSNWTGYIGTGSGTFYIYQAGTTNLIFSMAWSGEGNFTTNIHQYGSTSKTFSGSPASYGRVDVYHI